MSGGHLYLLDSEGLSQWVRGGRRMGLCLKEAARSDIPVARLWLYPGNGASAFGARKGIGTGGWNSFSELS